MTEAEAQERWCPFARVGNQSGTNRYPKREDLDASGQAFARCIASACMAWRSPTSDDFNRRAETAYRRDGARIKPGPDDINGFCGLAGRP